MTLDKLIQVRPLAVELLETLDGDFWNYLELSAEDFCRERKLDAAGLLEKAGSLSVPSRNSNWKKEPLYRLMDFLTADHRRFQETDLPGISHLLELHNLPAYPDGYVLRRIFQTYKAFENNFLAHMWEEEEYLFPRILRLEATSRMTTSNPSLHRGAMEAFAVMQNHPTDEELTRSIAAISEKVSHHQLQGPAAAVTHTIHQKLEDLKNRIGAHARLEVEILFPRAVQIQ